jgi:hypothetical protein
MNREHSTFVTPLVPFDRVEAWGLCRTANRRTYMPQEPKACINDRKRCLTEGENGLQTEMQINKSEITIWPGHMLYTFSPLPPLLLIIAGI